MTDGDRESGLRGRLKTLLVELMLIPGLSGHEDRVRRRLAREMATLGMATRADRLGNLIATAAGDPDRPSVMLFTHMDQLGFVVRKIDPEGFLRLERMGGVGACLGQRGVATPGTIRSRPKHP